MSEKFVPTMHMYSGSVCVIFTEPEFEVEVRRGFDFGSRTLGPVEVTFSSQRMDMKATRKFAQLMAVVSSTALGFNGIVARKADVPYLVLEGTRVRMVNEPERAKYLLKWANRFEELYRKYVGSGGQITREERDELKQLDDRLVHADYDLRDSIIAMVRKDNGYSR